LKSQKEISRSIFLKFTAGLCLAFFGWLWIRITQFQSHKEFLAEYRHNNDIPLGVSYFGKYYLYRTNESLRAFSTTCTHAGCRIGMSHSDKLQCSCHGSQFDAMTGKPLKGPAFKPLQELECKFDTVSNQWIVRGVV
jgi:Rieske Fe-S protein